MTDEELKRQRRISEQIRQQSSYMNDTDLRKAMINSALRREPGETAGYMKALQDNKNRRNNGGCFITTAVCDSFGKPDNCYELSMFRDFRDNWLAAEPDGKSLIAEYYVIAPEIVRKINSLTDSANIYHSIWNNYLNPCLSFIENGDFKKCKDLYVSMVKDLSGKYC